MRKPLELHGLRLVLVALVLGLVASVMYFPIWTFDRGLTMRILLAYITVEPLQFLLARVLPGAGILGVLAILLLEAGRRPSGTRVGSRWNRERVAILFAVYAEALFLAFLSTSGSYSWSGSGLDPWTLFRIVSGFVVLTGLSLYLYWTAERFDGTVTRWLGRSALALAYVSATLNTLAYDLLRSPSYIDQRMAVPTLSVAAALIETGSLGLWIGVYGRIIFRYKKPDASNDLPGSSPPVGSQDESIG
jgi:hypothetical protein